MATCRAPRYYLWNIGCQMNQADATRIAEGLESLGYERCDRAQDADLAILNTCVVRQSAENKVIGRLTSLSSFKRQSSQRALLVMGCFVNDLDSQKERYPYVDAFIHPSDVESVLSFGRQWAEQRRDLSIHTHPLGSVSVTEMVPISYGCDRHCTYCIVTLRRGTQRSRPIADVQQEVRDLVARGARDITLLGQNVDAYGTDFEAGPDLADLLIAVHDTPGLERLRFLTSHPRDMTQRIIDTAASLPRLCHAWELPVQSGNDDVLRRMGRGYTADRFRDLVHRIRKATPNCAINTDVIVGFPGETEEQFADTLELLTEVRFDVVHVAVYSPRPGTPAASWKDDVPADEKERRRKAVEELQSEIAGEINASLLGTVQEILVDGKQRGRWRGRTRTNKLVFFEAEGDWYGRLVQAHITWAGPWSMLATPIGYISERR
ncbi:MAG: tRNA (N6-isopentenyl adenosine(37)-C2)-methylthiotransferase MiaB [Anaerolineae bacterium]